MLPGGETEAALGDALRDRAQHRERAIAEAEAKPSFAGHAGFRQQNDQLAQAAPQTPRATAGSSPGGGSTPAQITAPLPRRKPTPPKPDLPSSLTAPIPNARIRGRDAYGSGAYGARRDGG